MPDQTQPDQLKLASIFNANMVLQRGGPIRLWGLAAPGAAVEAQLAGRRAQAQADAGGRWRLELPEVAAGGPYDLHVRSAGEECRLTNVLVGDVWVCSGQSNMEWTIQALGPEYFPHDYQTNPYLRLFTLQRNSTNTPVDTCVGSWCVASPEQLYEFSAVAFHFGRKLNEALDVPIGLITTAWGGTPAEAWTPIEDLRADAKLSYLADRLKPDALPQPYKDPGNKGVAQGYARRDHDDADWPTLDVPRSWQSAGHMFNGAVWFRRRVQVPKAWLGRPLKLCLGTIDDFDTTYFNGVELGSTGAETIGHWASRREYIIPARFVRPDESVIAVRVFDQWGQGGLVGPAPVMQLLPDDAQPGETPIPLTGPWRFKSELELPHVRIVGDVGSASLFNGMIQPIVGLSIAGAIWYQGESNAPRGHEYGHLLTTMIRAWRTRWGIGEFPFLIVQLANFGQADSVEASPWAELRERQHEVSRSEPNCGLACAIDIGEPEDIHPHNKRDVGIRLAYEALRVAHGQTDAPRSPSYRDHAIAGDRVTIRFNDAGTGLRSDGPVRGVSIAGEDRIFHDAQVALAGDSIVVTSPHVAAPTSVRYAWRGDPENTLRGPTGLPVIPFRTDDWPMTTEGAR